MSREQRTRTQEPRTHAVGALRGRRTQESAPNSLKFMANIEGDVIDAHVRSANGVRWRVTR